jgi:diphosphomevalonate decarboxylase
VTSAAVRVVAHSNIALSKYWGKREGPGNVPATPSLSVTLGGMSTHTRLELPMGLTEDRLVLNGAPADDTALQRARELLDRVREAAGRHAFAHIESANDFPTASGLASSASGFAALALAAVRAFGLDWNTERVADLARRSSASAARSLFGGFVELDGEVARQVAVAAKLPLAVLVCVTSENPKEVSSTSGMKRTAATSPYFPAWLEVAPKIHQGLLRALEAADFDALGAATEGSALAMHASAVAAGVVYWTGVTLEAMSAVRRLRDDGTPAYFTIDAGPHVKVLVRPNDIEMAIARMRAVPGVLRVLQTHLGDGARVLA